MATPLPYVERADQAPTGSTGNAASQRVLRNTYWLLALSMVPTVVGAWIGVTTGVAAAMSPMVGLVVFLGGAFGFMYAIEKTKDSAAGVPALLAFTFFMGVMLSRLIGTVLGMSNGAGLVMTAFAGTGVVFLGMATLASLIRRDLTSMGKFLFIGAVMLLVAGIANVFMQSGTLMITVAVLEIGIFSAFIAAAAVRAGRVARGVMAIDACLRERIATDSPSGVREPALISGRHARGECGAPYRRLRWRRVIEDVDQALFSMTRAKTETA